MAVIHTTPSTMTQAFKVRLESSSDPSDVVVFDVSPEVSESITVNYQSLNPIHMPGNIWVFQNTESRNFEVSARLIARTTTEARRNLEYFNLLRGWCQPYFGQGTAAALGIQSQALVNRQENTSTQTAQPVTRNLLGAPPDVLYFYAYSDVSPETLKQNSPGRSRVHQGNIYRIPTVIKSLSHVYPMDVDYIPTAGGGPNYDQSDERTGVPWPVSMSISISLLEVHSPTSFALNFNLAQYKLGTLPEF